MFGIIGSIISFIIGIILPYIIVFCLGWYCCNQWHHYREGGGILTNATAQVISVDTGSSLTTKAGLLGRRSHSVTLWGIEVPTEVEAAAHTSLSSLVHAGDTVKMHVKEGKKRSREEVSAIVTHNGDNINLEQLRRGWAKAVVSDADFVAAQTEAQKAHRGIWQKKKDPDNPHKPHWPFWKDEE
jgi:endonuclease YncB( thermonuclease family)